MPVFTEIIGYIAAVFGTALMLPQVYKSYKTKRVNDISISMLIVYILNCTSWEIYGILIHSMPVIICNLLALIIGIFQMVLKLKLQNKNPI
jgi:MtN3 and saliva related transmembrane protein